MPLDVRPDEDPLVALRRWYARACDELPRDEAHRVTVATVDADGTPDARIVLCRSVDDQGRLYFYTNYESDKGRQLSGNPRVALVFLWASLGRQLRIRGTSERAPASVSDAYWTSRPRDSQISALSSPQSRAIAGPDELARRRQQLEQRYTDGSIPRPEHWGGYIVVPTAIEFWEEGRARFHERIRFQREASAWQGRWLGA